VSRRIGEPVYLRRSGLENQYVIDGVNTNQGYGALGSYSIVFGRSGRDTIRFRERGAGSRSIEELGRRMARDAASAQIDLKTVTSTVSIVFVTVRASTRCLNLRKAFSAGVQARRSRRLRMWHRGHFHGF
jgi:hypothetical protein